jgi:septal ring factor EnvC (AmiA/AmiB activator)
LSRASVVLFSLVAAGLALGCGPDRAAELHQEIAKLEQERVPVDALEKAKQEADAAERDLAARAEEQGEARAELSKLEAEARRTAEAFDREVARNAELRSKIDDASQRTAAARKRDEELVAEVARERERAGYLRDRAETLARQMRPDDPGWANARRVGNLSQLLAEAARTYPDDPVLARLAGTDLGPSDEARVGAAAAAAAALCDRLRFVYGLEAAPVAAEPPAAPGE